MRREAAGQTVAHAAAIAGALPPEFDGWNLKDAKGRIVAHCAATAGILPGDTPDQALLLPGQDGATVAQTALHFRPRNADHATALRLAALRDRAKRLLHGVLRSDARRRGRGSP
jgi:hypothetical protein